MAFETPEQIAAAVKYTKLTDQEFAEQADLNKMTLSRLVNSDNLLGTNESTLRKIEDTLRRHNIEALSDGTIRKIKKHEIIEGSDCYLRTLDIVSETLENFKGDKELLVFFASDEVSPHSVNEKYRAMRTSGIKMRQLIQSGDTYIMGELDEYRTIPEDQFVNIVSLVFGYCVAQVNSDESAVTIYRDPKLAKQKRIEFEEKWNNGNKPTFSDAKERF